MNKVTEAALRNKAIKQYLAGEAGYAYPEPYADIPTSPDWVMRELLECMEAGVIDANDIQSAMLDLSMDGEYAFMVMYYLFDLAVLKSNKGIDLLDPAFTQALASNLMQLRVALQTSFKWTGKDFENGLWGQIMALDGSLGTHYGFQLFPQT